MQFRYPVRLSKVRLPDQDRDRRAGPGPAAGPPVRSYTNVLVEKKFLLRKRIMADASLISTYMRSPNKGFFLFPSGLWLIVYLVRIDGAATGLICHKTTFCQNDNGGWSWKTLLHLLIAKLCSVHTVGTGEY